MKDLVNKTGKTDDQFRRDAEVKLGIPLFPDVSWNGAFTTYIKTGIIFEGLSPKNPLIRFLYGALLTFWLNIET